MIVQKEVSLRMMVIPFILQNHLVIKKSIRDFSYLRKKRRLDNSSSQTPPRMKNLNLKFGSTHNSTFTASLIEFKKEDFNLDFNSAANSSSDKSTTDNF